ncbi:MAG: maleate isomerase [Hyphomicrobiaceae bacterium]|jgi:maleate isomerase
MKRTLIGVLTPSSNTILEPLTCEILADLHDVSAHFARFRVIEISRAAAADAQFEIEKQLTAAEQLADARVDAIVWSGTAASWLGFEQDERLCQSIQDRTGIPAGSSVLEINDLFRAANVGRIGLVTPYTQDIQAAIIANYTAAGLQCVGERHLGESRNFEFSEFSEDTIGDMIEAVAAERPEAIAIMCTNMRGARIAPRYEEKLGIPIFDSTSSAVRTGLKIAGKDASQVKGWGQMFEI